MIINNYYHTVALTLPRQDYTFIHTLYHKPVFPNLFHMATHLFLSESRHGPSVHVRVKNLICIISFLDKKFTINYITNMWDVKKSRTKKTIKQSFLMEVSGSNRDPTDGKRCRKHLEKRCWITRNNNNKNT